MRWLKVGWKKLENPNHSGRVGLILAAIAILVSVILHFVIREQYHPIPSACVPFFADRNISDQELYEEVDELSKLALMDPRSIKGKAIQETYSNLDADKDYPETSLTHLSVCAKEIVDRYDPPPKIKSNLAVFAIYHINKDGYDLESSSRYAEIAILFDPFNIYAKVESSLLSFMRLAKQFKENESDNNHIIYEMLLWQHYIELKGYAGKYKVGLAHSAAHTLFTTSLITFATSCQSKMIDRWKSGLEENLKLAIENSVPPYREMSWEDMLALNKFEDIKWLQCEFSSDQP